MELRSAYPLLGVALGGSLGAMARYAVSSGVVRLVSSGGWGTATVNVIGGFVLGLTVGLLESRWQLGPHWRTAFIVGVLGSFTTFSTFLWDAVEHMESGQWLSGGAVLIGSVAIGLAALVAGLALGRGF